MGVGEKNGVVAQLIERVIPTAHAQFNSWGDNPNAAGVIGTPEFTALEPTRLGPVMPGSNFELPLPIVSLGGRGLATTLMLYYNSTVWGSYFDPNRNSNVYAFDPIQSWPSPGFSLGFGRITYTNPRPRSCLVPFGSIIIYIDRSESRQSDACVQVRRRRSSAVRANPCSYTENS